MVVYIKNMVCVRCKMAVQAVLTELDIDYVSIELGKVEFPEKLTPEMLEKLNRGLQHYELELMDNKKSILVEKIKTLIIEFVNSSNDNLPSKFSEFLSRSLNLEYTYLANIFSESEGSTIEKFYILWKIERVKQMLVFDELSIKEISFQLNYSSEAHLCQQFKKVTGETPSMYRKSFKKKEDELEDKNYIKNNQNSIRE